MSSVSRVRRVRINPLELTEQLGHLIGEQKEVIEKGRQPDFGP
jgi:hypothetical protein